MNWSKTIDAIVGNNTDVPRVLWMFGCGRVIDMEVWTESSHKEIIPFWQVNDSGETQNKQVGCGLSHDCEGVHSAHSFPWQVIA